MPCIYWNIIMNISQTLLSIAIVACTQIKIIKTRKTSLQCTLKKIKKYIYVNKTKTQLRKIYKQQNAIGPQLCWNMLILKSEIVFKRQLHQIHFLLQQSIVNRKFSRVFPQCAEKPDTCVEYKNTNCYICLPYQLARILDVCVSLVQIQ